MVGIVNLETLWEPPSDDDYAALRDDIDAHGQRQTILVDEYGNIIDGFTRKRICDELGLPCLQTIKPGLSDDEKVEMAITSNMRKRQISRDERDRAIEALKRLKWSNRKIGATLGISHHTVEANTDSGQFAHRPGSERIDADGKTRRKVNTNPAPEETKRRSEHVIALSRQGYSMQEIADAMGVSRATIRRDFHAANLPVLPREERRDGKPRREIPGDHRWKNEDIQPPPPKPNTDYRAITSRILRHLQLFGEDFRDHDYANNFAWRIEEGFEDIEWLDSQRKMLETVLDQTQRLLMIIRDSDYRRACRETNEGRENLRKPTLRVVNRDA